jgi:hypothetical protein
MIGNVRTSKSFNIREREYCCLWPVIKIGKVFTSKSVGTGPTSYEKRIYQAAVSQRLRNTGIEYWWNDADRRQTDFATKYVGQITTSMLCTVHIV